MSPTPHSKPELSKVHILSLLEQQSVPADLHSAGIPMVECVDEICSSAMNQDSTIVILAERINSELKAAIERIQLTLTDAAIIVALPSVQQLHYNSVNLIGLGVHELASWDESIMTDWQRLIEQARARRAYESQLKRFSHYDPLTQLANRSLFQDRLEHSLLQNQRRARGVGVLFLDLDRFRVVNDIYGHHIGDQLLVACAERMMEKVRRSDTLARLGSNSFAVILDDVDDDDGMYRVSDKLNQAFTQPFDIAGHEIFVSTSIGMQLASRVNFDVGELVRHTELALHDAKRNGRNARVLYREHHSPADKVRLGLESALHHALERQELYLAYQPQIDLNSCEFIGVEALMRWRHPVLGNVPPTVFIPVLEDTGLIDRFGLWAIQSACEQFSRWLQQQQIPSVAKLSVNLSPRQFRQPELAQQIKSALQSSRLSPKRLTLEVTESMLMNNLDQGIEMLAHLRRLGVSVAIDDFGTGYSSLSYLKDLPIDYLKIDRVFVKDIVTDDNDAAIANSIIGLAHNLGLKVIAEGVEDKDVLERLIAFGCDQYQGYYFSRPIPAEEIPEKAGHCRG